MNGRVAMSAALAVCAAGWMLNAKVCWSGDKSAGLPMLLKLASFPFLSEMTT